MEIPHVIKPLANFGSAFYLKPPLFLDNLPIDHYHEQRVFELNYLLYLLQF